jgi:hypothetical protein
MQQLFRAWDIADTSPYADGFTNVTFVESLFDLQAALAAPRMTDEALRRTLDANFAWLEQFAYAWQSLAATRDASLARFVPAPRGGPIDVSRLVFRPAD